jgi:hypothetical protein
MKKLKTFLKRNNRMATVTIYASDEDHALYSKDEVDFDPVSEKAEGYSRFAIPESFTLTAEQVLGHYGDILEILVAAGVATEVE